MNKDLRPKRGRGRGSRGSYKPRGKAKFVGHSFSSTYGSRTSQVQRVCINPEILRRLGYSATSKRNLIYSFFFIKIY